MLASIHKHGVDTLTEFQRTHQKLRIIRVGHKLNWMKQSVSSACDSACAGFEARLWKAGGSECSKVDLDELALW